MMKNAANLRLWVSVVALAGGLAAGAEEFLWKAGDWKGARGGARVEGDVLVLPTPRASLERSYKIRPEWGVLRLRGAMATRNVPAGEQGWQTARFAMVWHDAAGETISPWPPNQGWTGTSDWREVDVAFAIPTNAATFSLSLCNLTAGGEVRFRAVSLELVRERALRPGNAPLPPGVVDPESLEGAAVTTSATRRRISLNGVWRVRPALRGEAGETPPGEQDNWGWTRIPDVWATWRGPCPAAMVLAPWFEDHADERERILPDRAWYSRTFTMPADAAGRRVAVTLDMVASRAILYIDGARAGMVEFPGGEVDLTPWVRPGATQRLVLDVSAHAEGETLDYNEATRADLRKRDVKFPGVTGDMWLEIGPKTPQLAFAWAETSVACGEITFIADTRGLAAGTEVSLGATATHLKTGETRAFSGTGKVDAAGRVAFTASWRDAARWDVHTPFNRYSCRVRLVGEKGEALDETTPFEFGFRDVGIDGRRLLLNGTTVHLRALYDSTYSRYGAHNAYTNAVRACRAAQKAGFNAMIAGNYSFAAGATPYLQGILDAADETGLLYCFSLPHFKDYADLETPAGLARYRADTEAIMRLARRHPSVILWSTSHNAAGYLGAGHPQRIDGLYELPASANGVNRRKARACRKIIGELDASRPCYHHESGNLDDFHCVNCYLDWAPIQERDEWLEHWATVGVKPLFFVEWGLPHISNWSSYRGPLFIWRKPGYQSLWSAEYAAAYRDDAAYEATPEVRAALGLEERLWRAREGFAWGRLTGACRAITNNYLGVQAQFAASNWRSMRAWGMTAMLPWDQEGLFERVGSTVPERRLTLADVRKEPGFMPETVGPAWGEAPAYGPTALGLVFERWNQTDCAWIGGAGNFTDKRHHYAPGARIAKQLVILNDRRESQRVRWQATFAGETRRGEKELAPGACAFVPVEWTAGATGGCDRIEAAFEFADGVVLRDAFAVEVIAPPREVPHGRVALYDPVGLTAKEFERLGVACERLAAPQPPAEAGVRVVVARGALTPDVFKNLVTAHARRGGRVVVFEQDQPALEAVGFRVQTLGLRHAYPRYRSGWLDDLLVAERLRDWCGASTLVEPLTPLREVETGAGSGTFAGFGASRVWRNGNRGTVASVLPEKPTYGDWCALVDGGFDLQYAPLLEWRLGGSGAVLFCQMDVTGRSEPDALADALVRRLALGTPPPAPRESIAKPYGMQAYMAGLAPRAPWFIEQDPEKDTGRLYLVSGGAGQPPDGFFDRIAAGGTALLLGLNAEEVRAWCPAPIAVAPTNHCHYTRIARLPPELNGLSNADWAWHGAMDFAAFTEPAEDGNVAVRVVRHGKGRLVFWQVPPWMIDAETRPYLRTSKRRAEAMLSRLMGNLGFKRGPARVLYGDVPRAEDDPYRYFHW
ncbi:MAG: hypothetical protein ACI4RA_07630 [Kiritimatiellia bacterium]